MTVLELTIATSIFASIAVGATALVASAMGAQRQTTAEQQALRTANSIISAIVRELKDASDNSVQFSVDVPGTISFRRVTGYDEVLSQPILTPQITLRSVPFSVPGTTGLMALERAEAGARTTLLGGYVSSADPLTPGLPGVHFDVLDLVGGMRIDIVVAVAVPSGAAGLFRTRVATSVSLQVP